MKRILLTLLLAVHLPASADLSHPIHYELDLEKQQLAFTRSYNIAKDLRSGKMSAVAARTNFALDAMIRRAVKELRKKGHHDKANEIEGQWRNSYSMVLFRVDIGDFEPLSDWLSAVYISLELLLGKDLMKALHLDDIHILNHTIPVVFRPCKGPWARADYAEHFGALSGVIGYWTVFTGCVLGTAGFGLFFCVPAGMLSEMILSGLLGPSVGRSIFDAICS